jgi:pyruvate dehydrogenase E2 component (dihydrolipoamide acetyltransferase)
MPVDVIMPKVDMVMDEGTVVRWYKGEGEQVTAGEPLFDIETDKATMEVEAPASGTLAQITAPGGATVPVATVIARILQQGETLAAAQPAVVLAETAAPPAASEFAPRKRATPLARRIAREHGLDLTALGGGGPLGRVRKNDVLQAIDARQGSVPPPKNGSRAPQHHIPAAPASAMVSAPAPAPALVGIDSAAGRLVPLAGVRKIIAQRLTLSAGIPQFVLSMDVNMEAAAQLRERLPYRPSVTALIARVVASLLPRHPSLNASFREDGIWLHTPVHLGIALDSGGDLLVPVIRDAHRRSLSEIGSALGEIRQRAEAKKLTPSELQGSTFSISNLGMFGVDQFTALVNPPEAAILAVGRSARRPFESNGTIIWRQMLTLTLSADHRVTDGAAAARFLQDVRAVLEEPLLLL